MKKNVVYYVLCILTGGLIFGGTAFASNINVNFLPLKYFVNGEERIPLPGQQGFIYNGRAYVPLRFLAESLGCGVEWDRVSSSVYMTITPDDIPAIPRPEEQIVNFTGVWKTQSGSIYKLKQNGTSITGTFTHYADKPKNADRSNNTDRPKHEFPLSGKVEGKTVELSWAYDDAEEYANIKDVPLAVAEQVVGITETVVLALDQEANILDGYYYQNYVQWDNNSCRVVEKSDGNSPLANSKLPPLKVKLFFSNPI